MDKGVTADAAAAVRQARFGTLPERIRFEDMVEGADIDPDSKGRSTYNPEASWNHFSCVAADLAL
ncbi:hypothetical protein [Streptomyces sp. NPDC002463]|uniref:hypothetical protein n=1 Tax=Streptomyces sp. NPDC002463 TaxID=3364645 RepID=UPI0036B61A32